MSIVRVTRLLEYQYESVKAALADMDRWACPPNGFQRFNDRGTVRSAVIGPVFGEAAERIHTAVATGPDEEIERLTQEIERLTQECLDLRSQLDEALADVRAMEKLIGPNDA